MAHGHPAIRLSPWRAASRRTRGCASSGSSSVLLPAPRGEQQIISWQINKQTYYEISMLRNYQHHSWNIHHSIKWFIFSSWLLSSRDRDSSSSLLQCRDAGEANHTLGKCSMSWLVFKTESRWETRYGIQSGQKHGWCILKYRQKSKIILNIYIYIYIELIEL